MTPKRTTKRLKKRAKAYCKACGKVAHAPPKGQMRVICGDDVYHISCHMEKWRSGSGPGAPEWEKSS